MMIPAQKGRLTKVWLIPRGVVRLNGFDSRDVSFCESALVCKALLTTLDFLIGLVYSHALGIENTFQALR